MRWKHLKKKVARLVKKRMNKYQDSQRIALLQKDGGRSFFKNAMSYMSKEKPKPFDVVSLFPGKTDSEVSELLAGHFNAISCEFCSLEPCDLPSTSVSYTHLTLPTICSV